MDVRILNTKHEIKAGQGFQRDSVEVHADVHFKAIQRYLDTQMNLVVIAGGQKGLQVPHYHKKGFDFFVVLEGKGWLHTADLVGGRISAKGWQHLRVQAGDSYGVEPNQVHCLLNDGAEDLVFLNVSPVCHMDDDYFAIEDFDPDSLRRA